MRVPAEEICGSGEWSCCFSYNDAEERLEGVDNDELSTINGEWKERASERACFEKTRRTVLDIVNWMWWSSRW